MECYHINRKKICTVCGAPKTEWDQGRVLADQLLLSARKGGDRTVLDELRAYAYSYASQRNMPIHLADDALGNALVRLTRKIHRFNPDKGEFIAWAKKFVKNELRTIARLDADRNSYIAFSLDDATDGIISHEALSGDDHAYDLEERDYYNTLFEKMRHVAYYELGTCVEKQGGKPTRAKLYPRCVEAYQVRDGEGWITLAARLAGLHPRTISNRRDRARRRWKSIQEKERSLDLQDGGSKK